MPDTIEETRKKYNERLRRIFPIRCSLNAGRCKLRYEGTEREKYQALQPFSFVMRQYTSDCDDMEIITSQVLKKVAKQLRLIIAKNRPSVAPEEAPSLEEIASIVAKGVQFVGHGYCNICALCLHSYFGIAELGHLNPNVLLEVGMMNAFGKPVILTLDTRLTKLSKVPFDLSGYLIVIYDNQKALASGLESKSEAILEVLKEQQLV